MSAPDVEHGGVERTSEIISVDEITILSIRLIIKSKVKVRVTAHSSSFKANVAT